MPPTESDRTPRLKTGRIVLWTLVVVIGAVLAFIAAGSWICYYDDSKEGRARADMQTLTKACKTFHAQHGRYPESLSEITDLMDQGQHALTDPWGNTYQYQPPADLTGSEPPFVFTFDPTSGRRISERDPPRRRWHTCW